MFWPIFLFELKYRLRQPATWLYFGVLLLMGFLLVATAGGLFGAGVQVGLGGDGQADKVNSPFSVGVLLSLESLFTLLIVAALMGTPVYRDVEYRAHALLYTLPISKWGYLGGRFWGSYVVAGLVFGGLGLGAALGAMLPGIAADRFLASAPPGTYLWPYVLLVLPNLFALGTLFFTLAALTRNLLSVYLVALLLLLGNLLAAGALHNAQRDYLAAVVDAFGINAQFLTTRYWTAAEKNTLLLPLSPYLALNRAAWLGIGTLALAWCYGRFSFSIFAADKAPTKALKQLPPPTVPVPTGARAKLADWHLPTASQHFTGGLYGWQWSSLTWLEFRSIVRSRYFLLMAGAGALYLFSALGQADSLNGTPVYPRTGALVSQASSALTLLLLLILTFYSGELVWRERAARIDQLTDAAPVPGWVPLLSKLAALGLVQVLLLSGVLAGCLLWQASHGYFQYEMGLYLRALFGHELAYLLLLCALAIGVQVLVNNKFVGFFVMGVYYLADLFRGQLGFSHRLLGYGGSPSPGTYSDMNGYGQLLPAFWWTKLYWAGIAGLLLVLANLLWVRGTPTGHRWQEARRRWGAGSRAATLAGLALALGVGSVVFYNTNVLNQYRTPRQREQLRVSYERQYRRLRRVPQPRIVAVQLHTDIYPATRAVRFQGYYMLVNKHTQPLDTVVVSLAPSRRPRLRRLALGAPGRATLAGLYLFRLAQPLAAGDSLRLALDIGYQELGFPNDNPNTDIVANGTFLTNDYLPSLGYAEAGELRDDQTRRGYAGRPWPVPTTCRPARIPTSARMPTGYALRPS